jgi:Uma2 family endonuclease
MTPQKSPHMTALHLINEALRQAIPSNMHVRMQGPLALDPDSEPEPDLLVVTGTIRDYSREHPRTAALVVEVADTSLTYGRQTKRPLYARAGIPEYWIVNLLDGVLEVFRDPEEREGRWDYRLVQRLMPEESVSPLHAPTASIRTADLLP